MSSGVTIAGAIQAIRGTSILATDDQIMSQAGFRTPPTLGGRCAFVENSAVIRFTGKERDSETGLDFFEARYYSSAQGRFTSPDEFTGGPVDPFTGGQVQQPGPFHMRISPIRNR